MALRKGSKRTVGEMKLGRQGKHFDTISGKLENDTENSDGAKPRFHLFLDKLQCRLSLGINNCWQREIYTNTECLYD